MIFRQPKSWFTPRIPPESISCVADRNDSLLVKVKEFTLCRETKLRSLVGLARHVCSQSLEGDFVECGVYKGGSAALVGHFLPKSTNIWCYDSFQGMPPVTEQDGPEASRWVGECAASADDVRVVMDRMNIARDRVIIREGFFQDTFVDPLPEKIQFLHIDADWYESVLLALRVFYHRVVDRGVIILDDFGHWEGCREAFYDFCYEARIKPLLNRFENDQAFWFKGIQHHRDGWVHTVR